MVHRLQVIEHIHAGNTTQQIKTQLVAQETTDRNEMGAVNGNTQKITLKGFRGDGLTRNLRNWGKVAS